MTMGFQKRCLPPAPAACADLSAREIAMVGRMQGVSSAGLEAQLYGRQDACRYLGCGYAALSGERASFRQCGAIRPQRPCYPSETR